MKSNIVISVITAIVLIVCVIAFIFITRQRETEADAPVSIETYLLSLEIVWAIIQLRWIMDFHSMEVFCGQ